MSFVLVSSGNNAGTQVFEFRMNSMLYTSRLCTTPNVNRLSTAQTRNLIRNASLIKTGHGMTRLWNNTRKMSLPMTQCTSLDVCHQAL